MHCMCALRMSLLPFCHIVAVYIDHEVCIIRNDMYEPVTIVSRSFTVSAIFLGRLAARSLMFTYRYICTCTGSLVCFDDAKELAELPYLETLKTVVL